jgi:acyl carrier protein|uniref:Acyl carrier protein n=1 Tax=Ignavibacterium album TaxID=591197 RepID=A0A7V2ZI93_9BACT
MSGQNYSETVKNFITENFLFGDDSQLKYDTPLFEKGIIDSTGVLELVSFIEENYKIIIQDDELVQDNFSSISAIEKFLHNKLNHQNS